MLFFASGFINYCFAMNNDYFFINSSDTSQQLALPDEFLSENYEFRHNVLSDVYEIRELGSEPKPFRPFTREARNSLLRRIKSWDGSMSKRMTVLWQIMAGEISSVIIYNIELQCVGSNLWQMADFSLFSSFFTSYSFRATVRKLKRNC